MTTPPGPLDMPTLVYALRDTFKGCEVVQSKGIGLSSHHCKISFDVYEIRVIMSQIQSGTPRTAYREMQFRFSQQVTVRGSISRIILQEVASENPDIILQAIKDAKAYLLGCVQAIQAALNEKPVQQVLTVDDLF